MRLTYFQGDIVFSLIRFDFRYRLTSLYRASHIILDYFQALTQKYADNTRKTYYFLLENIYRNLIHILKKIHYFKFSD